MMQHLGDITKLNGATIEPVWCVTGGSPCQDLSIAGKRAGLAGARSGLFMEQIRVIKEMREHDKQLGWTGELIRPRYMVWENVPGALSSNKGRDFAAVLEETIRIVEPEAPGIEVPAKGWPTWGGYRDVDGRWSVAWRVHDAQYWGVPQRRENHVKNPPGQRDAAEQPRAEQHVLRAPHDVAARLCPRARVSEYLHVLSPSISPAIKRINARFGIFTRRFATITGKPSAYGSSIACSCSVHGLQASSGATSAHVRISDGFAASSSSVTVRPPFPRDFPASRLWRPVRCPCAA